jgi:hypothetical protein
MRRETKEASRRRWGARIVAGMVAGSLGVLALPALAAPVSVDTFEITAGGPGTGSTFDQSNGTSVGDQCIIRAADSFSPVEDGTINGVSNAFDGGMGIEIGQNPFLDSDDIGNSSSTHDLTVGPEYMRGLSVKEKLRGLTGDHAILRVLLQLQNLSDSPITRSVVYDSSVASAAETQVVATSDGDKKFTKGDRWILTSDAQDGSPDLPPIIQALYGPGKTRVKVSDVPFSPTEDPAGDGEYCVTAEYKVTIPAHATRSLLFFSQLVESNPSGKTEAKRFNKNLASFFTKMTTAEKKQVLNWNL